MLTQTDSETIEKSTFLHDFLEVAVCTGRRVSSRRNWPRFNDAAGEFQLVWLDLDWIWVL